MGFVDIKVREFRTELGGKPYHVVSPRLVVGRLFTTALGHGDWYIWGDETGFEQLAELAMLAAVSPNTIVYVPKSDDTVRFRHDQSLPHDLVFANHQIQLLPSKWKEIRGRLGKSRLSTKSILRPDPDTESPIVYKGQPASDPVDLFQHSGTVFIVSSKPTLTFLAGEFQSVSTCESTGDHSHLFNLMRRGGGSESEDLTMVFAAPEDWQSAKGNSAIPTS